MKTVLKAFTLTFLGHLDALDWGPVICLAEVHVMQIRHPHKSQHVVPLRFVPNPRNAVRLTQANTGCWAFSKVAVSFVVMVESLSHVQLSQAHGLSLPGSSVHGISQARRLEWVPFLSPGDLPYSGIEPGSPALAGGFFTTEPPGKPNLCS